MSMHHFDILQKSNTRFKLMLIMWCVLLSILFFYLPVTHASGKPSGNVTLSENSNQIFFSQKESSASLLLADTSVSSDQGQKVEKAKKTKKKIKSPAKQGNGQIDFETGIDEDDDNDMYVPYEKWRVDTFDNWGTHKKKKTTATDADNNAADSSKVDEDKQGFSDKEKESFLMYPADSIGEDKDRDCTIGLLFRQCENSFL